MSEKAVIIRRGKFVRAREEMSDRSWAVFLERDSRVAEEVGNKTLKALASKDRSKLRFRDLEQLPQQAQLLR
jgi:hypothetical protein